MNEIVKDIHYSVTRDGNDIELLVTAEGVSFRLETIPDGVMAGMKGHREVPWTREVAYAIPVRQAEQLYRDLGRALGQRR